MRYRKQKRQIEIDKNVQIFEPLNLESIEHMGREKRKIISKPVKRKKSTAYRYKLKKISNIEFIPIFKRLQKRESRFKEKRKVKFERSQISISSSTQILSIIQRHDFKCPICLDTLIFPIITPCGHQFCSPCFHEAYSLSKNCSYCKEKIRKSKWVYSKSIWDVVKIYVNTICSNEEKSQYANRCLRYLRDQTSETLLNSFHVGDIINFFLPKSKEWSRGKITDIVVTKKKEMLLKLVLVDDESKFYLFRKQSPCLALYDFFPKRTKLGQIPLLDFLEQEDRVERLMMCLIRKTFNRKKLDNYFDVLRSIANMQYSLEKLKQIEQFYYQQQTNSIGIEQLKQGGESESNSNLKFDDDVIEDNSILNGSRFDFYWIDPKMYPEVLKDWISKNWVCLDL